MLTNETLVLENMGIVVGITLLCGLQADRKIEICALVFMTRNLGFLTSGFICHCSR